MAVEANHKGGDEIEFFAKVGKGMKSSDSLDHATNAEERGDFCEHSCAVQIETQAGMAEQLGDVKKISCTAAKIENALPSRQIELDVANAANVDRYPAVEIEIFPPILGGIVSGIFSSGKRFPRKDLSVCFLALANPWPLKSFLILWSNRTPHLLAQRYNFN